MKKPSDNLSRKFILDTGFYPGYTLPNISGKEPAGMFAARNAYRMTMTGTEGYGRVFAYSHPGGRAQ